MKERTEITFKTNPSCSDLTCVADLLIPRQGKWHATLGRILTQLHRGSIATTVWILIKLFGTIIAVIFILNLYSPGFQTDDKNGRKQA
jgi:hypothetical protein